MKRLFIAINLPQDIKRRLTQIITQIDTNIFLRKSASSPHESTFRWLPPENWHLTLVFLGYQPDEAIGPILEVLKETAKNFQAPFIEFEKIIFAPSNKPLRMIWLTGSKKTSQTLAAIKKNLEDTLIKNGVRFHLENRGYNAHLTLARFSTPPQNSEEKLLNYPITQLPIFFIAQSLDLMESHLHRTGAEYEILSSAQFK